MWERCRYCGSFDGRLIALAAGDRACPRCAGSPLCDACGHPRESHHGVFARNGRRCRHVWLDLPSLTKVTCNCEGFTPVVSSFREASFAAVDEDEPPLRLA
jgi:hypothetical protein